MMIIMTIMMMIIMLLLSLHKITMVIMINHHDDDYYDDDYDNVSKCHRYVRVKIFAGFKIKPFFGRIFTTYIKKIIFIN